MLYVNTMRNRIEVCASCGESISKHLKKCFRCDNPGVIVMNEKMAQRIRRKIRNDKNKQVLGR